MALEIERKFLVCGDGWRSGDGTYYCQGYLNAHKDRTVRVRIADEQAWLTVKGPTRDATRFEFEYQIPVDDASQLLKLCEKSPIEKIRRRIQHHGFTWEVDEFSGENAGLVVAEIELAAPDQSFDHPAWLGEEVTEDPKYYNSNLSVTPYNRWPSTYSE